jgi:PhnB protein
MNASNAKPSATAPSELNPHLCVKGAQAAVDFYVQAFGATLAFKLTDPADGRIGHAELQFGSTRLYLSDEYPDFGAVAPETLGGSPVKMHLYVADVDAFVTRAVAHGATVLRPAKLEFYGDRSALLADPFGYGWFVASKVEEVSPQEMQSRWDAMGSA